MEGRVTPPGVRPAQPSKDTFPTRGHQSWGWAGKLSRTSEPLLRVEGPGSPWGPLLCGSVLLPQGGAAQRPGPPPQGRTRAWSVLLCFYTCPIVPSWWVPGWLGAAARCCHFSGASQWGRWLWVNNKNDSGSWFSVPGRVPAICFPASVTTSHEEGTVSLGQ